MDCNEFGVLIRENRLKKRMTQKDLAKILNVSDKAVSKWERGECFPDINLFESLSDTLDVPITKLMLQPEVPPKFNIGFKFLITLLIWAMLGIALCVVYLMLPVGVYVKRINLFIIVCAYFASLACIIIRGNRKYEKF